MQHKNSLYQSKLYKQTLNKNEVQLDFQTFSDAYLRH